MIFRPHLASLVMFGSKTVTRRLPSSNPRSPWYRERCALEIGRDYSVQPGRGKPAIGRIRITSVSLLPLGEVPDPEAWREGFPDAAAFRQAWIEINGAYDPAALVWRIGFERVDAPTVASPAPRRQERSEAAVPSVCSTRGLERPVSALGWELRADMALRRTIRLVLSDRCDGVLPTTDGQRILEGRVERVSPTDAFAIVARRHVPLGEVLAIHRQHFSQDDASDPTDLMEREAIAVAARLADSEPNARR